jgi:hypothetical protein
VVAHAKAEYRQDDAGLLLLLHDSHQLVGAGDAHIEVAAGAQDHPIDVAANEVIQGDAIGQLQARAAVGRTTGHGVTFTGPSAASSRRGGFHATAGRAKPSNSVLAEAIQAWRMRDGARDLCRMGVGPESSDVEMLPPRSGPSIAENRRTSKVAVPGDRLRIRTQ